MTVFQGFDSLWAFFIFKIGIKGGMLFFWFGKDLGIRLLYLSIFFIFYFLLFYNYKELVLFLFLEPYNYFFEKGALLVTDIKELFYIELGLCFVGSVTFFVVMLFFSLIHFCITGLSRVEALKLINSFIFFSSFVCLFLFIFLDLVYFMIWLWIYLGYPSNYVGAFNFSTQVTVSNYFSFIFEFYCFSILLGVALLFLLVGLYSWVSVVRVYYIRLVYYCTLFLLIIFLVPADLFLHIVIFFFLTILFELIIFCLLFSRYYGEVA